MENVPEWLQNVLYAALGGLGALILGLMRANVDNRRTRTEDRSHFTEQVIARLASVEQQMQDEREYCDKKMLLMKEDYEERISKRDEIITELRIREDNREKRLDHIEKIMQGLD